MKNFEKIIYWDELNCQEKKDILLRPIFKKNFSIKKKVMEIVDNVKNYGDSALKKYSILFEKNNIEEFEICKKDILLSSLYVSNDLKSAIETAKKNITIFHKAQNIPDVDIETQNGVRCQAIYCPLDSIGIYIPSGIAPLLSTVLMLSIPAKIAGCKNIILCSPPPICSEILYAANICGVDRIFQIGGAQSIAALAFGTKSVPKVNKIFGPGNAYVTEAKLQVSSYLNGPSIDMLAGPSELLIISDETADPDFIAADLLSQAEHGISSQVILVTTCIKVAKKVIFYLKKQLKNLSKSFEIPCVLKNCLIILTKNLPQCTEISNMYAPEHLIINTKNPRLILNNVLNASSIFLGSWSPESAGDYASGTNHVLPTYGKSISTSALGLYDFKKRVLVQELTSKGFMNLSKTLEVLSEFENLEAHKYAVKIRVNRLKEKK